MKEFAMNNMRQFNIFCLMALLVWTWLVSPSTSWAKPQQDDAELRRPGARSTLQIKTTLENDNTSYGSAIVWKKDEDSLIIATAYHVLEGATTFKVLAPQLISDKEKDKLSIPSSKFELYVEPTYDLVLLRLKLTAEKEYSWLSEVQPVKTTCKSPESKSGRAFGFPGFYKGRFSLYDPEVTLGRADMLGNDLSMKYLNNSAKMKILHLTLDPTAKGMSGGPVIDKTGCFRGMVIGRLPDILGIAVNYKDICSKYDIADFKNFDSQDFTEKTVFTALAEEHLSADDETVVNEVSWRNATDWGNFFDDPSVFRRQFQDIHIDLKHYRYSEKNTDASLILRQIGYERGKMSLLVNGEKVTPTGREFHLSQHLCPGQNKILITKKLRELLGDQKRFEQIWLNDVVRSNRLNLAVELGERRIYRIHRELPALIFNSYKLFLYLYVDKLPNGNNKCQPTGTKNGQFAIRLPSLHQKLFGPSVKIPLLWQSKQEAKKPLALLDTCLKLGTKDSIQSADSPIKERSRCESVCVNKKFGYVDFGLFSDLTINKAEFAFDDYEAGLIDEKMLKELASSDSNGKSSDNPDPLSFPLYFGLRLELLNNKNTESAWILRVNHADFLKNRALIHLGDSHVFGQKTNYLVDVTDYLPAVILTSLMNTRMQSQAQDWFKWAKEGIKSEFKSSVVDLAKHENDDWLLIDVQIGEEQKHQSDSPVLDSEFASRYPKADILVQLKEVKMDSVALGDLIPDLSKQIGLKGSLNMSSIKVSITLPDNLAAIDEKTDYCQDNEADSKIDDFGDFYGKLIRQLFRRVDIEIDIKTLTSDQLKLKNATLSLSLSELSVGERLTGKVNGSLKQGIIELDGLRIKVPEQGIRFTIDFDEQREEDFIQLQIQDRIPLHFELPQGQFQFDLQPIQLALSKEGNIKLKQGFQPITIMGSPPAVLQPIELPEAERSFLPLSVRIPVSTLKELIVRQLPHPIHNGKHDLHCSFGDCTAHLVVTRHGHIDLNVTENRINYSVPLHLHAKVKWKKRFFPTIRASGSANINLHGNSTLGLRKNWLLASTTQLTPKVSKASIHLKDPLPDISVRSLTREKIRPVADKLARELDKELAKINVKKEVAPIWADLQNPRKLVNEPPLWFTSQLDQVYFGGLQGNGEEIKLDLAVAGKLDGQVSDNPPPRQSMPLPALTVQSPPSKHFEINLPLTVKLAKLKQQLMSHLKPFKIREGLHATLNLQDFYGNGTQLVAKVGFTVVQKNTPLLKGHLFMSGQPIWNETQKQLEVRQFKLVLDNAVDQNNAILLKQLAASSDLKDSLVFPLAKEIEQAKQALEQSLNREISSEGFYLKGDLNTLSIKGVYVQKEQVLILLNSTGQMEIIKK